jgi:hypothetical protein
MKQATLEAHFILETHSDEYYSCYAVNPLFILLLIVTLYSLYAAMLTESFDYYVQAN